MFFGPRGKDEPMAERWAKFVLRKVWRRTERATIRMKKAVTGRSLARRLRKLGLNWIPDDGSIWTWPLRSDADASHLVNLSTSMLLLDSVLVVAYVSAAWLWMTYLGDQADEVISGDSHRFGPAGRRIKQWAGFGFVLVAAAGFADALENLVMFLNLYGTPDPKWIDALQSLAWLKLINLGVGLLLLFAGATSAFWRLCVERVHRTVPEGTGDPISGPRWTSGRNQSPAEFAPSADDRPGICLSGGGIRSASFSLGALQAIQDSRMPKPKYITSVSGGAYMAGAWQSMRSSVEPDKRVFQERSPEERWVRHHTDYLVSSFSVVVGAIGALLSGLVINLLILLALASVIILPLGWVMGLPHPELRARTPILDIAEQPEVKISDVTYSATVPLPGGKRGPGYLVGFTSSSGIVRISPDAKAGLIDRPLSGCLFAFERYHYVICFRNVTGQTVTEAVVAESGGGGLEVVRQPSLVLGPETIGQPHTGDPAVQSIVVVREPSVSIGALEGSTAGPPSVEQRGPLSVESWMVLAGVG